MKEDGPRDGGGWSEVEELLLAEWGDLAQCYQWLHARASARFARTQAIIGVPGILLSALASTASFGQSGWPEGAFKSRAATFVGCLSLAAGLLNSLQHVLKVSERKEAARIAALNWGKLFRAIELELAKPPRERGPAAAVLELRRADFERLLETGPDLPLVVADDFRAAFAHSPGFDALHKPNLCQDRITPCRLRGYACRQG